MLTNFALRPVTLDAPFKIALTDREFYDIVNAIVNLRQVVRIEEQWDAVVQNYLDFERALLDAAAREMIIWEFDEQTYNDLRLRFAVKLSNLLSGCKAYLDHTPQRLDKLSGCVDPLIYFTQLTKKEYDERFGYRLMEALRNHAQHHGLPLHGATTDRSRVMDGEIHRFRYAVATQIDVEELRENRKFKKSVLAELEGKNRVSSERHVRAYIEGLSAVHDSVRDFLKDNVTGWLSTVSKAIDRYKVAAREAGEKVSTIALAAVEENADGKAIQNFSLTSPMVNRIMLLQRRNRHLVNLSRRFVTSEAPERH